MASFLEDHPDTQIPEGTKYQVTYSILAVISLLFLYKSKSICIQKPYYRQNSTIQILFPLLCLTNLLLNLCLAIISFSNLSPRRMTILSVSRKICQSLMLPPLLLVPFEICYILHTHRSVNFCALSLDEKHRRIRIPTQKRGIFVKNVIRLVALGLWSIEIMIQFRFLWNDESWEDGGRMDIEDCGWRTVISEIGNRKGGRNDMYLILSLIPDMTLLWVSFFLSIVFWRYVF